VFTLLHYEDFSHSFLDSTPISIALAYYAAQISFHN